MLTNPAGVRGTYLYNGSTNRLCIPSGTMLTRAMEDEIVVIDQCEKAPDPSRPSWPFKITEDGLTEYKGTVTPFSEALDVARLPENNGDACKLYSHTLSRQAVRGAVSKYKTVPHPVLKPQPVFQINPGETLATSFNIADVGYSEDVALHSGWSLATSGSYLIPNKRHPLFWAFAGKFVAQPQEYVHLRQD